MAVQVRTASNVAASNSSTAGASLAVSTYTGIQTRDLVLIFGIIGTDKTGTINTPVGYTKLVSRYYGGLTGSASTAVVYTHQYVAGDPDPSFTWTGAVNNGWTMRTCYSDLGQDLITGLVQSIDDTGNNTTLTSSAITIPSILSGGLAVVRTVFGANEAPEVPAGMTSWATHLDGVPAIQSRISYFQSAGGNYTPADTTETASATAMVDGFAVQEAGVTTPAIMTSRRR
jgi:hypothetical protein